MEFDFIHEKKFKTILERDYEELSNCISIKASKATLIISGSIVEAVLTDYFIETLPIGKSKNDILKSNLGNLLDYAESGNLITKKEKQLGIIIKDYRNLIHPGKEIRTSEEFDFETAKLSKILLDIILKKLRNNHLKKYGYNSDEIIDKLKNDWEFNAIYGIVITKLDHNEREKLLSELIKIEQLYKSDFEHFKLMTDYDPSQELREMGNLEDVKIKVQELKPLIKTETITEYLQNLKDAVIKGESITALTLYSLFHEELNQLSNEDNELIAIYMLSMFESVSENCRELAEDKTYSTIGKYIQSDKGKSQLKTTSQFCVVHFGGEKVIEKEMDVYQQIFNSVSTHIQNEISDDLINFLPENKEDMVKFGLKYFYDEAVKRNIINEKYGS